MNRRDLLTYAGAAGLVTTLGGIGRRPAVAATPSTKKHLILVCARGGWDTTVALDPKVQSTKVDVPVGRKKMFGQIPIHSDPTSRPNVDAFFTKYATSTAVVRGISVSSVVHAECMKRMATGTRNETNADMGAIVAHDQANDLPLPYLILGDTAYAGPYAASAGRVGSSNQIVALLDPAQGYRTNGRPVLEPTSAEEAALAAYAAAGVERTRATRGSLGYNAKRVDDFASSIERSAKLKVVRDKFGTRGSTLSLPSQVELALQAIEQDISHSVMLSTRVSWDSHDNIDEQITFADTTFAGLTQLMDGLVAKNLLDDTVVVCFSEFARTPKLNVGASPGKDHWPVTAALVMGGGIKPGAYGETGPAIEAQDIVFRPGDPARTLTSQHFVAGVLTACGVTPAEHLGPTEVFDAFVA